MLSMTSQVEGGVTLSEQDHVRLIRAIESAIEVQHLAHFHAWLRGPFRNLLHHDCVVCVEHDGGGVPARVESLYHGPCSSERVETFCDPADGLAVRLAALVAHSGVVTCIADGAALDNLLPDASFRAHHGSDNAIAFRTNFVSGGACYFILFGLLAGTEQHCLHLLKLLSSHLKMAWSRVTVRPAMIRAATAITEREQEILRCMQLGRSNQEVSLQLGISPLTLKNHIRKIYRKLDVQTRAEAISRGLGSSLDALAVPPTVGCRQEEKRPPVTGEGAD